MATRRSKLVLLSSPAPVEQAEPAYAASSDDELMMLARGGLPEAFDALVRRYQARALRVAARQLGQSGAAPDVVQNTFVEIYRALPKYQARGRFPAYLYRILLNQCRMVRRSPWLRARSDAPPGELGAEGEAEILARERERELAVALSRLSVKLRQVVLLRFSAELRYEEIAEALEIPVGTVKRRLFDAMARLRELLEDP